MVGKVEQSLPLEICKMEPGYWSVINLSGWLRRFAQNSTKKSVGCPCILISIFCHLWSIRLCVCVCPYITLTLKHRVKYASDHSITLWLESPMLCSM